MYRKFILHITKKYNMRKVNNMLIIIKIQVLNSQVLYTMCCKIRGHYYN